MELKLLSVGLIALFAFNALLPVMAGLLGVLFGFYTRGRFKASWCKRIQEKKWKNFLGQTGWDGEDTAGSLIFLDCLGLGLITILLCLVVQHTSYFHLAVGAFIILCLIAPRYFMDLVNAVKYNFKTKDSDRLAKLEAEIAKLKK